ncbi:RNA polymerase sigma factor [Caulobacter sp. FWC2]|uniref:RNA polymerase sigma factor n=1 Tax=Caulobacter sp. FWC2 TaxID=69664 RepID=UPI000C1583FC|nr:RNA polymerase sigma factor [Caulobacter sp. FWC2]PIB92819.1 RNA polymerase subunit sigma-24 [Caulobacter sp. FWC2]
MTTSPDRPDAELARAAASGDERAYAELVRRHKDGLYRLLRRYVGDPDDAYEAAHEAFIAAWSALPRYDPNRPFGAWLKTIAINKARDRARRLAVRRFFFGSKSLEDSGALEVEDGGEAADATVMATQRRGALDQAIAGLPDGLRGPLILTALEGCSHQEAGDILGLSAKTVEMRAYRARKLLAETVPANYRDGD